MSRIARVGIVIGGYIAAIAVGYGAVAWLGVDARGAGAVTSDGMASFGDSLLFLAAFGIAAVPATGTAFYFLRSATRVWPVLSGIALGVAATGVISLIAYLTDRSVAGAPQHWLMAFAILRIIIAPLFALTFGVAGLFAPSRRATVSLLIASAVEAVVFACALLVLISASR